MDERSTHLHLPGTRPDDPPAQAPEATADLPSRSELYRRLDECITSDRRRIHARVRTLERQLRHQRSDGPDPRVLSQIVAEIERSIARVESRRRVLPTISYPDDLPVVQRRDDIAKAIRDHQVVVICGQTGSGKTTQIPKICLELGRGIKGFIGHTQPRRIAARAVAARIAEELNSPLGGIVGYKVRFHDQVGDRSLIKLMTDGILLAETQNDRFLSQYDTLIVDEAHERSLNIDFLLGYLRQLLPRRPDLKLIITSATIDPQRFADHFALPNAPKPPMIEVSGRAYPVEIRYRPLESQSPDEDDRDTEQALLHALDELAQEPVGDVLVFLPGEREIRETADTLRRHSTKGSEIVPLFARLSAEEQQRVFSKTPQGVRRIVLATNVAETSLTVPGIRYVIDTGVARISRYSPRIKVQRLPIEAISKASAAQRAGRCGRVAPGVCIRLYSEQNFDARPDFTDPEIQRTNLASVILQMKALDLGDIEDFPFLQAPDQRTIRDGYDTLLEINALEGGGLRADLTSIGRRIARLPLDPRIARMIIAAEEHHALPEVLVIAAALSVQDPRERPMDKAAAADTAHELFEDPQSDFLGFLNLWRELHKQQKHLSGGQFRKFCHAHFVSYLRFREWIDIHRQLVEIVEEMGTTVPRPGQRGYRPATYEGIHTALLTGLLSNIARRNENAGATPAGAGGGGSGGAAQSLDYDAARNNKYAIFPGSSLFRKQPKWIMAADVVKTTRTYARNVASIQPAWIERVSQHLVKRSYVEPHWDAESAQAMAYENVTLYGLELVKRRRVPFGAIDPNQSRSIFIHHALVNGEYLTNAPFFEHNFALQRGIKELEEKARTKDLLADQATRFQFYSARVPQEVNAGTNFEKWRRKAEAHQPGLLNMQPADLLAPGVAVPTPEQFPDTIVVAGHTLRLTYKHDPGADDDGVSATLPDHLLPFLPEEAFEWLVPGMLREKIVALIKALPKGYRGGLTPAPIWADRALERLAPIIASRQGDLFEALTDALRSADAHYVPVDQWSSKDLPVHLRVRFQVVDEHAKVIGAGRDLTTLRVELARRAAEAMARLPDGPFNRANISTWEWNPPDDGVPASLAAGPLPEAIDIIVRNRPMRVYPALVDEGVLASVSVRPFDSSARARESHALGVRKLLSLQVTKEARSLIATMPGLQRLALLHAPLGREQQLIEDLADLACAMAFDESIEIRDQGVRAFTSPPRKRARRQDSVIQNPSLGPSDPNSERGPGEALDSASIRTRKAFEHQLDWGWDRLGACGRQAFDLADRILATHHSVSTALANAPTHRATTSAQLRFADIQTQLQHLVLPRFLGRTPHEWLTNYPRFLQAIERRLRRVASEGEERDWSAMQELLPYWKQYLLRIEQARTTPRMLRDPALIRYRWMLEEFRVSLFAQQLGTGAPVSRKRLENQWLLVTAGESGHH